MLFFGSSVPQLSVRKEAIHFDMENCQYEVLEIVDLVFVHDFSKENLLVESGESIKDRFTESELKTVGWPVSLAGGGADL